MIYNNNFRLISIAVAFIIQKTYVCLINSFRKPVNLGNSARIHLFYVGFPSFSNIHISQVFDSGISPLVVLLRDSNLRGLISQQGIPGPDPSKRRLYA